jgi:hypothetical protein
MKPLSRSSNEFREREGNSLAMIHALTNQLPTGNQKPQVELKAPDKKTSRPSVTVTKLFRVASSANDVAPISEPTTATVPTRASVAIPDSNV